MGEVVKGGKAGNAAKAERLLSTGKGRYKRVRKENGPQEMSCQSKSHKVSRAQSNKSADGKRLFFFFFRWRTEMS